MKKWKKILMIVERDITIEWKTHKEELKKKILFWVMKLFAQENLIELTNGNENSPEKSIKIMNIKIFDIMSNLKGIE
jgi:hypothetical protein